MIKRKRKKRRREEGRGQEGRGGIWEGKGEERDGRRKEKDNLLKNPQYKQHKQKWSTGYVSMYIIL